MILNFLDGSKTVGEPRFGTIGPVRMEYNHGLIENRCVLPTPPHPQKAGKAFGTPLVLCIHGRADIAYHQAIIQKKSVTQY